MKMMAFRIKNLLN